MPDENTDKELPKVTKQPSSTDRPISDEESGKVTGGAISRTDDPGGGTNDDLLIP